jgi:hypothetical protein
MPARMHDDNAWPILGRYIKNFYIRPVKRKYEALEMYIYHLGKGIIYTGFFKFS